MGTTLNKEQLYKLDPRIRMIANSTLGDNVARATQAADVLVKTPKLLQVQRMRADESKPAYVRKFAELSTKAFKQPLEDISISVFVQLRENVAGLPKSLSVSKPTTYVRRMLETLRIRPHCRKECFLVTANPSMTC